MVAKEIPVSSEPYLSFVRPHYESRDPAHDFRHIERILERLSLLANGVVPTPKTSLLFFVASFHGLLAKLESYPTFREETILFLEGQGWSPSDIDAGFESLRVHLTDPRNPEERIVHDANYIELLGAFGIAKAFTTGGAQGQSFEETIDIYETRYLDAVTFKTPEGQRLAAEGKAYAKAFLARLRREL